MNNCLYKSNCLSDAQLLAAKYSLNKRVHIPEPILEWAADGTTNIETVITDNDYYPVSNRDSMNHVMKRLIYQMQSHIHQTFFYILDKISKNQIF